MQAILSVILIAIHTFSFDIPKSPAIDRPVISMETSEYFGSFDFDDKNKLVFRHFPQGPVKPAILYIHRVIFENSADKKKIKSLLNNNIKIDGRIIKFGDEEFLLIEKIEPFFIEM